MTTFYDRVKVTMASAPGTGAVALGAPAIAYRSFDAAGVPDQAVVSYAIEDGGNWEIGHGTYTKSGATMARTTVVASSATGNAAINVSASAVLYLTLLASDLAAIAGSAASTAAASSGPISARFWRISNLKGNGANYVGTGELQFFDVNGTMIASAAPFSNGADTDPIAHVNDGDLTTFWTTSNTTGGGYVGLDLGTGATPYSLLISNRDGNDGCDITSFNIDYSNDKQTWTTLQANILPAAWTTANNQTQTFKFQTASH